MTDDVNLVPDDEPVATKPDAIVIIEDKKPDDKTDEVPRGTIVKDAAAEGVEALARNLEEQKKKVEAETAKRIAAESKAHEAESRAATAETKITAQVQQNIDANRTAANNAKLAAQAELEKAEADYISLQSEGKFKEAFEATRRGAKAQQQLDNAEGYLVNLDATVERMSREPAAPTKPVSDATGTVDPVTGLKLTPKTFDWVSNQGDKWKDQDFRIQCDAADRVAKRKGLKPDTDEYFEFIEDKLRENEFLDPKEEDENEPKPEPKKIIARKPGGSVSAAPTRAVQGTSGVAKKGVKLSGAQREATAAILDSLPDWFPKGTNSDQVAAKSIQDAAANGEQWAIDQLAASR